MLPHMVQALLAALMLLQVGCNEASNKAEAAPGSRHAANAPTDSFYIRHGRSKVRHSSAKEHLLRGLRPLYAGADGGGYDDAGSDNVSNAMATHDYGEGGAVGVASDNEVSGSGNVSAASAGGKLLALSSSIQSGNGQLFGSEYWRNSDANGSLVMQSKRQRERPLTMGKPQTAEEHSLGYRVKALATELPDAGSTLAPVTHRIRKLHMKKIMESIRKSVDKGLGGKLSKNHRSLVEAEQLQGRPTDVSEDEDADETVGNVGGDADAADDRGDDDIDSDVDGGENNASDDGVFDTDAGDADDADLDEVLQLADELDLPANSLQDSYQDDEYITTTPTYATTKSSGGSDADDVLSTLASNPAAAVDTSAEVNYGALSGGDVAAKATVAPRRNLILHRKANEVRLANPSLKNHSDAMVHKQQALKQNKRLKSTATALTPYDTNGSADPMAEDYSAGTNVGNAADANGLGVIESNDEVENLMAANDVNLLLANLRNETDELHSNSSVIISNALDAREAFVAHSSASEPPAVQTTADEIAWPGNSFSLGPSQLASTSVGGISLERQQSMELGEINFDDAGLDNAEEGIMDDGHIDNHNANGFPLSTAGDAGDGLLAIGGASSEDGYENRFLAGAVDAANEDEIYDWDEISRNNRRNLMRGRDVVTKFLQIVETQHSLGSNCEAGTSLNLGEGVVDRYAQDRFRVEAEVAVNRANMLTRIFKMTAAAVQADVNLLHASVLSMVEFDDDIFAAGNCFDWNEHPAQPGLFCPFAYRLPPPNLGAIFAKDLATEYHYLGNTSEWFFQARKNAEKVIARNEQYLKSFHLYSNKTDERIEDDTLAVKYEDGRWSKPYYDCGGGNIWMLTYTVPFFGYENSTYHFKGTSGIDIDLRRVDIDQCPQRNTPGTTQPLNIFAGTDKCKQRTTMCEALKGLGFRRGSYKCICRKGYYFPDTMSTQKFFNGSLLEEEYEKLMLGKNSTYNIVNEYECLPCAEGCESCEDGSPCIAALNWPMRTSILVLACTVIGLLPPAAWFTFRYQQVKVVRAASPALLRVIALGAFFIYCTNIVMYPNPNLYTCTARIWLREIGFSLTYGALMLKTWRISVIFRVRSAKAVKITDAALLKRLGIICGVIGTCLLVRTLVSPPDVVVGRTADDLKAFLCKTDWWDYTFTSMEVLFLAWGVRLCIMVRKAPSEFNESRFISMAIYNEFLLTCFLNVSMLFLQSPANPDLLYIIFFCHTQLTVTLLLGLIFGSKVYIVLRSGKSHQENIGLGAKSSGAKFNFRPQVRTFANPSSVTTSTVPVAGTTSAETKLSDQEALEEIRQLSMQLQRIQEMAPPKGVAVMTISSLLDGLKTPGGMMMVAAAATQAASTGNQLTVRPPPAGGALPLLSLNGEMQKYHQQLHAPQNNNVDSSGKPRPMAAITMLEVETSTTTLEEPVRCEDRAMNTDLTRAEDFHQQALGCVQGHIICSRCLVISREHHFSCRPFTPPTRCQQLGSPLPEGSISFANIKLECMCSQPDDLDVPPRRCANLRSAATNTPPPTGGSTRRRGRAKTTGSSPNLQDAAASVDTGVSYRICDNCKVKYRSNKSGGRKFRKSSKCRKGRTPAAAAGDAKSVSVGGISQMRSSELLDRRRPSDGAEGESCNSKKMHSTDDIIFYTTTDDSSDTADDEDADEEPNSCLRRRRQIICQSTSALSASCSGVNANTATGATAAVTQVGTAADVVAARPVAGAEAVSQSAGNVSAASNNSNSGDNSHANNENQPKPNGGGRSKRPDKLILDLNDRSKYTKEVSV